jgi:hypothetical protein
MTNPVDSQTRNGSLMIQGNQYIKGSQNADPDEASEGKANLYGQNGYTGASSDLPGQRTSTGFLPQCAAPKGDNWQTRKVSAEPLKAAHGMKSPGAVTVTKKLSYR